MSLLTVLGNSYVKKKLIPLETVLLKAHSRMGANEALVGSLNHVLEVIANYKQTKIFQNNFTPISNETQFTVGNNYEGYGFESVQDSMGMNPPTHAKEGRSTHQTEAQKLLNYIRENRPDNESISEPRTIIALGENSVDIESGVPQAERVGGQTIASGVVLVEPDGRVWLRKVANNHTGYAYDFAKGMYEAGEGLTLQQAALKELYEKTGFEGAVTGFVGDQESTGSVTRYYVGQRVAGSPADHGWETEHMVLVDATEARKLLNSNANNMCQKILDQLVARGTVVENKTEPAAIQKGVRPLLSTHYAWPDLTHLEMQDVNLGGATGAKLYLDKVTGKKYIVKAGGNPAHIRAEYVASQAYEAMGVRVPRAKLYEDTKLAGMPPSRTLLIKEFLDGAVSLKDYMTKATSEEKAAMKAKIQEGFAADALLGNWDVIGPKQDNIMIHNGEPVRIDPGGALMFSGIGNMKPNIAPLSQRHESSLAGFNKYAMDFWSMRGMDTAVRLEDSREVSIAKNIECAEYFSELNIYALADQVIKIDAMKNRLMAHIPKEVEGVEDVDLKRIIGLRLYYMRELADQAKVMQEDGWKPDYVDGMLMHRMGLRQNKVKKLIPKNLAQESAHVAEVYAYEDPILKKGVLEERGGMDKKEGASALLNEYVDKYAGGKAKLLNSWFNAQVGSSQDKLPLFVKYLMMSQQHSDETSVFDRYFWNNKTQEDILAIKEIVLKENYVTEKEMLTTFQAQHAFIQEMLRKVQFRFNDQKAKSVELIRLVNSGHVGKDLKSRLEEKSLVESQDLHLETAVYESFSLLSVPKNLLTASKKTGGDIITKRTMPHHRIICSYFQASLFANDENEFIALPSGIPIEVLAKAEALNAGSTRARIIGSEDDSEYFPNKKPKNLNG